MPAFLQSIDGYKTYIVLAFGVLAVLVNHFIGPIPNVNLNSANWLTDIWTLLLGGAARSALN